jgi:hypothetical protein
VSFGGGRGLLRYAARQGRTMSGRPPRGAHPIASSNGTRGAFRGPVAMHAGAAPSAEAVIIGFPDYGVGYSAMLRFGQQLWDAFGSSARYLDISARYTIEREVIRIGNIPSGFPRQLLHRYIFGDGSPLILTPAQFLRDVGPKGSIYDPNSQNGNPNEHPYALFNDIKTHFPKPENMSVQNVFTGSYTFSCFHGAHSTAGLGRFRMDAVVEVRGASPSDWQLDGSALMVPESWDFNWAWSSLSDELLMHHPADKSDLHGRERRTALGSMIPGKAYMVAMSAPVRVQESSGRGVSKAVFSL